MEAVQTAVEVGAAVEMAVEVEKATAERPSALATGASRARQLRLAPAATSTAAPDESAGSHQ